MKKTQSINTYIPVQKDSFDLECFFVLGYPTVFHANKSMEVQTFGNVGAII